MPKLIVNEGKKIILPSSTPDDEAYVIVKETITSEDWLHASQGSDDVNRQFVGLSRIITDWNFTDAQGEKEPITPESVGRMLPEDFRIVNDILNQQLINISNILSDDEKKTLSLTSTPSSEAPSLP